LEPHETSVPAFEEIPSIASSREACSNYGEAVQSNVFYVIPIAHPPTLRSRAEIESFESLSPGTWLSRHPCHHGSTPKMM
jgi:hypothetical protein